jgi:ABC-type Fe3+-hydroxamate transport system substrate-binding protein
VGHDEMLNPMRIVSTVPSQTELLSYLGLDDEIVGITKFCVHPEHIYRHKTRVGGTKDLDTELIASLSPDLIITNKEENEKEQVSKLSKSIKVHVTDVHDLTSALDMIKEVSLMTDREEKGQALIHEIEKGFNSIEPLSPKKSVLYLIWKNPWMSIGRDTFIHDILNRCGLTNVMDNQLRYPEVTFEEVNPDLIFLSSEPFPFKEGHIEELRSFFPEAQILLVDGEYFSWYGSRLAKAPKYLNELIGAIQP